MTYIHTYIHTRFDFILLHFRPTLVLEVMEIGLVVKLVKIYAGTYFLKCLLFVIRRAVQRFLDAYPVVGGSGI